MDKGEGQVILTILIRLILFHGEAGLFRRFLHRDTQNDAQFANSLRHLAQFHLHRACHLNVSPFCKK